MQSIPLVLIIKLGPRSDLVLVSMELEGAKQVAVVGKDKREISVLFYIAALSKNVCLTGDLLEKYSGVPCQGDITRGMKFTHRSTGSTKLFIPACKEELQPDTRAV